MSEPFPPIQQREFRCEHCKGLIRIPANLPATTGPCPHCGDSITSPGPDEPVHASREHFPSPFAEHSPFLEKGPRIVQDEDPPTEIHPESKRSHLPLVSGLAVLVLAVGLGAVLAVREMEKGGQAPKDDAVSENPALQEAYYIRTGWKKEAYQVLDSFVRAKSARDKLPYVLHGESISKEIEAFYADRPINDSDTPAEAFSVFNLSEEDRKRGLFMLVFDQPPQFNMRDFFRPLASLEVQYGLEEADILLSSMARLSNFATDPLRVHAFFKKTPQGLKINWEIFVQTKYSMLRKFLEDPQVGKKEVFRLFIMEDVHDPGFSIVSSRTYRIADPANTDHTARIVVPVDSDVGRELSAINWVGTKNKTPETRTVTLELEWRGSESQPHLAIGSFLCWEFLELGGEKELARAKQEGP